MKEKSVTPTPTSAPIRDQISQMSPMSLADLADAPENTDDGAEPRRGPNGRTLKKDGTERAAKGSRRRAAENVDPLMDDPRYAEAVRGLNFYGAPRILKRGFQAGAKFMKDDEIALSSDEEKNVDNYFYALSKHTNFDPMATLFGRLLLFVLLMGELILWRWLKYSALGKQLQKFLDEHETEAVRPTKTRII